MGETGSRDVLRQFGRNLRQCRSKTGLSQEDLAAKAGMDRTYVGSAERGERNISLLNIVKLAGTLGVEPGHLLNDVQVQSGITRPTEPPHPDQ